MGGCQKWKASTARTRMLIKQMPITIKKETWGTRKTFICTKEDKYTKEKAKGCQPVLHPDAFCTGFGCSFEKGNDYDEYYCPNCKITFRETLPDA